MSTSRTAWSMAPRGRRAPAWRYRSLRRFFQRIAVSRREGFHESVRQMVRRHLDQVAVEAGEQVPVLRLVGGTRLAAPRRALESRLELGGIEPVEKLDEGGAQRLRQRALVNSGRGDRVAQPLH